jgi:hypothetical protein
VIRRGARGILLIWSTVTAGDAVVLMNGQKSGSRALAAVFLIAGLQHAFAGEPPGGEPAVTALSAGTDGAEYLDVAASCDVVICSYVTKTVICHRLNRACAYRPLPRYFHPPRHQPRGSNFSPSSEA